MKNYYFKIQFGYGKDDYISITQDELHKALALFITGGRGVFQNGAVRGSDIVRIIPDWHKEMGWNPTHQMDTFDWEAIEPKKERYKLVYSKAKEYAAFLIENGKEELLSKPFPEVVKEIPIKNPVIDNEVKKLASKFTGKVIPN